MRDYFKHTETVCTHREVIVCIWQEWYVWTSGLILYCMQSNTLIIKFFWCLPTCEICLQRVKKLLLLWCGRRVRWLLCRYRAENVRCSFVSSFYIHLTCLKGYSIVLEGIQKKRGARWKNLKSWLQMNWAWRLLLELKSNYWKAGGKASFCLFLLYFLPSHFITSFTSCILPVFLLFTLSFAQAWVSLLICIISFLLSSCSSPLLCMAGWLIVSTLKLWFQ